MIMVEQESHGKGACVMMIIRGRRIFMLRVCVILILAMAVLSEAYSPKETYIRGIREEWGITLPIAEWEIYNEAAGSSFAGKGVRYHVFRYQDAAALQKAVSWHRGRNMLVERKVDALLRDMEITKGYEVNFNGEYQYFTLTNRGSAKELFLLYFPAQNRLSVVEDYI